ncbi:toll/interleukin-1 receptor domain-containing protein [Nodosilinea sp. PGN35]|uniref:toll/interleukin-1 receptor domain-containing protein n=1 Tax=Nodosilinea sp. PGN35 TaxID=3020489 RepID=UPI0023B2575A|nr:toll/interleukin-1 receptor domain-containing protein [Nodosilinea sp. TSF1-S3]MDF0368978.1 toll/interleukin-1 receptor domain-containing protein [Nodosilinea sp. TSF1-S3]
MPEQTFDVFLAHNSKDKPLIQQIYKKLRERGIKPWLDTERIAPGDSLLEKIQEAIIQSKTAAICIGSTGVGKWQSLEAQTFIGLCIQQGVKVIPVLLPSVKSVPNELFILQNFRFVQFEENLDDEQDFDLLEWGITGVKRESLASLPLDVSNSEDQASSLDLLQQCDPTKILFIKNVKDPSGRWAYLIDGVLPSKTPIFELMWRPNGRGIDRPKAGDLMLLHQQAKVTHLVEFLDEDIRKTDVGNFRLVKVIWMPKHKDWHLLPHQKEILGFDPKYRDGNTHSFRSPNFIRFNQAWKELKDFQYNLLEHLAELS